MARKPRADLRAVQCSPPYNRPQTTRFNYFSVYWTQKSRGQQTLSVAGQMVKIFTFEDPTVSVSMTPVRRVRPEKPWTPGKWMDVTVPISLRL